MHFDFWKPLKNAKNGLLERLKKDKSSKVFKKYIDIDSEDRMESIQKFNLWEFMAGS